MWSLVIKVVDMCNECKCADDVEHIWDLMHDVKDEEAYFLLYDRVCALEDRYNDGRWA